MLRKVGTRTEERMLLSCDAVVTKASVERTGALDLS